MSSLTFFDRLSIRNRVATLALSAVLGLSAIGIAQFISDRVLSTASDDYDVAEAKYETLSVFNRKILALKVAEQTLRAERKAATLTAVDSALTLASDFQTETGANSTLTQPFLSYTEALDQYRATLALLGYRDRQSVVVAEEGQEGIEAPSGYTVDTSNAAAKIVARIYEELEFDDQPAVFQVALAFEATQRDILKIITGEDNTYIQVASERISALRTILEDPDLDSDFAENMSALLDGLTAHLDTLGIAETSLAAAQQTLTTAYSVLDSALLEQLQANKDAAAGIRTSLNDTRVSAAALIFGVVVVTLMIQVGAVFLIVRSVSRNLSAITGTTNQLADGNLNDDIPLTEAQTEVGELARALLVFRDNALERHRLEAAAELEIEAKGARQAGIDQTIAEFKQDIVGLLSAAESTIEDARTLASGLVDVSERNSDEASATNEASSQASENVQAVAGATQQLSGAIGEISQQITHTSHQIEQVSASAKATNDDVSQLAEAASKIDEILILIQAIAEKTNLLALNATIEAARAGEHGRGFSVVASEVKSLANQTATATDEISGQIKAIQNSSQATVTAIAHISGIITEVQQSTVTIVGAVEEQTAATNEISQNIGSASERTQQMAENVSSLRETASDTMQSAGRIREASSEIGTINKRVNDRIDTFLKAVSAA
ncbi:MAG: HAMP domain-containing methyl-accepting chemotaxis protein [Roseibium sp.]